MKEAIAKLDAERKNFWHEIGLEMQKAFEENLNGDLEVSVISCVPARG
jgi:hypothetical protein